MIVYGRNAVAEAVRGRRQVERIWVTGQTAHEGSASASDAGFLASAEIVAAGELERLCGSPDHQGVCADVGDYPYSEPESLLAADDALVVCLDEVQDPHNLGAVCRVAECAGAAGVVICERRAAQVTPAVCRASAGAVEHLAVARARNLADFLLHAKEAGAWCYGTAADAAVGYDEPDYDGRVVLVLGGEGKGLRPRVAAACDELVSLPMRGRIESLNVSTAASALVYGILQSRNRVDRTG